MHTFRLRHLARAAIALAALVLPSTTLSAQSSAQLASSACAYGKLSGAFNLPVGQLGGAQGLLRAPDGTALFALKAEVAPDPNTPFVDGTIDGVLHRLQGPNAPTPVAAVKGRWQLLPNGTGLYELAFVQPGGNGNPTLFGAAKGVFVDPPNPSLVGQLKGKWAACP